MEVPKDRIVRVLQIQMETQMKFSKKWGYSLAKTKYPNVYQKEKGGYLVRARVTLTPGQAKDVTRSIDAGSPQEALALFEAALKERSQTKPLPCLSGYAKAHLERKISRGKIKSASGEEKWRIRLGHLLGGIDKEKDGVRYLVRGLGDYVLTDLRPSVEEFLDGCAPMVEAGVYSPVTINGWLAILRTLARSASLEYDILDFMRGIEDLDTSEWHTYSEESPNALRPEDVPRFLSLMKERHPQHYAMVFLGFMTGLRPSTLRPLRRSGAEADVLWTERRLLVRRSETKGRVMATTKTGIRYSIHVPQEVLDVLKWHIDSQLSAVQEGSDLLFPSDVGGFRSNSALKKPFADVGTCLGLSYRVTPRCMRRTYQDLARAAQVSDLVTRSVSGHATQEMAAFYSTVNPEEQRASLTRVLRVIEGGRTGEVGKVVGDQGEEVGEMKKGSQAMT